MPEEQPRPIGRPRDPDINERLMSAALEEYAQTGWSGFTMQRVAQRAGVGKSALYRRWADREQLLVASIESVALPLATTPDSGSLRGDLIDAATRILHHFLDPMGWATLRITVDSAVDLTTLDPFQERIIGALNSGVTQIFTRAAGRGEISSDLPVRPLVESLFGSLLIHVLSMPEHERDDARRNSTAQVEPLVDVIMRAAARHPSP
ncbi:transcriptional regulator, TetR family [Rhodococcus rhodochrous J3]|uniref:Transcriptional regulator, TetR family n=1 Tax=Rhodococcus rhodochrous J3 TaxID=903528 RepID=A0ABY1MHI2_RHORH|nr:TetR/AcrR family transcriptional regulator [Rhodococcus rhodochrous]MBF4478615.1 TetR/AcrR family transcriptional regulator [Rhodococcus rhodochrous]MCD2099874.1 TetR/AcrR family transcriptional regulator [Rhodococcus rhodochrous]MCD2124352.1 TetR/AcrR family transcriptional regulator [Rhodococcus rhodochrous]MCQ4135855.1 TetR/AcrR family transcriptional regulator [Rhodococcus rhodochrous]MDJ0021006.1 TetR/AcrR family transcriptional regulator [Rhodococcus rhodochrous]